MATQETACENTPDKNRPFSFPAIVACGYKRIKIQKSGNTFPALLITFESFGSDANPGVRFAWRSKKDFLLLARAAKDFPKAAFKKVVDESVVPWRRSSPRGTNSDDGALPDCLFDKSLPNHYSARMTKSIFHLDSFLRLMQNNFRNCGRIRDAWDLFCRHSDTENLFTPKGPSQISQASEYNTNDTRSADALDTTITTTFRDSSRLGQYFASKENSKKVVECALDKVLPLCHRNKTVSTKKIIFVEPSCGHGDIIVSLVESLNDRNIPRYAVGILGYDIDPGAIQICRERFRPSEKSSHKNRNEDTCSSDYTIFWECKSFFETTREGGIHEFDTVNEIDGATTPRDILVCFLGGPPYTTGQGSGSTMKRDLPERFVDHCMKEWKADVVSFLLPARYTEDTQKIVCDGTLVGAQSSSSTTNNRWIRETIELEESKFFFRGTTEVTQPSIIKLFYASEESGDLPKLAE